MSRCLTQIALVAFPPLLAQAPPAQPNPTPPAVSQPRGGAGDLMVMPTRVVLEGRDRSAEITLRNAGQRMSTYRIFFKEMEMLPTGQVEERPKAPGALVASDMVRFSPRQVDLAPGETQTIRIQLRKPEGLPDGEYRSHMVFQGVPPPEPPKPAEETPAKTLSFELKAIFGISIPVIVRHGEMKASVALADLNLAQATTEEPAVLSLRMDRQGNRSVLGDFEVRYQPASGREKVLLPQAGVVIYPNLPSRIFRLDLGGTKGNPLKTGKLKVTFTPKDFKHQPVTASLDVP